MTIFQRLRENTLGNYGYHLSCLYAFPWTSATNNQCRRHPQKTGYKKIKTVTLDPSVLRIRHLLMLQGGTYERNTALLLWATAPYTQGLTASSVRTLWDGHLQVFSLTDFRSDWTVLMGRKWTYDFTCYMNSAAWAFLSSLSPFLKLSDTMKCNDDGELSDPTFFHILWK